MTTLSYDLVTLNDEGWARILASHGAYHAKTSPVYDEVLSQVAERVRVSGDIGKADIGALLFWKRLRADTPWVSHLMTTPDATVRATTARALSVANDLSLPTPDAAGLARGELSSLPGLQKGDALASALLLAAAPQRMAIYDRRAQAGLGILGLALSAAPGRYRRYMVHVDSIRSTALAHGVEWAGRDVDVALYQLGQPANNT